MMTCPATMRAAMTIGVETAMVKVGMSGRERPVHQERARGPDRGVGLGPEQGLGPDRPSDVGTVVLDQDPDREDKTERPRPSEVRAARGQNRDRPLLRSQKN